MHFRECGRGQCVTVESEGLVCVRSKGGAMKERNM
jgi:hypothetical protein